MKDDCRYKPGKRYFRFTKWICVKVIKLTWKNSPEQFELRVKESISTSNTVRRIFSCLPAIIRHMQFISSSKCSGWKVPGEDVKLPPHSEGSVDREY